MLLKLNKMENLKLEDEVLFEMTIHITSIKVEGISLSEHLINEAKASKNSFQSSIFIFYSQFVRELEISADMKAMTILNCMSVGGVCNTQVFRCGSCGNGMRRLTTCSNGDMLDECLSC